MTISKLDIQAGSRGGLFHSNKNRLIYSIALQTARGRGTYIFEQEITWIFESNYLEWGYS